MPAQLENIDSQGFASDIAQLRRDVNASLGEADYKHLRRMEWLGRLCTLVGYGTAWIIPNPISAFFMSMGNLTRWLLMHHISHRGYDKVPGVPARYTSQKFAMGWRRFVDWFDWILPNAWAYEHNTLHHYNTGEVEDPDLVEHNMEFLREGTWPAWARYAITGVFAVTWKISYYAPNTYVELVNVERRRRGEPPMSTNASVFNPMDPVGRAFWAKCLLPYALVRFVALPLMFLPLGGHAALFVFINSFIAELMTNLHSFCVIGPNHSGEDLYRFDSANKDRGEFFVRQVVGSVNYACGSDGVDYAHAWLNYQIEHHVLPDISMLQYQRIQPRVKALCEQYGIPYVQESVFKRVRKLVDIMVGNTSMLRIDSVESAGRSANHAHQTRESMGTQVDSAGEFAAS
jgi:fatty acid desaturase